MNARQADIDRRLRDQASIGLVDWLDKQRTAGTSYGVMSRKLYELTGDSVSYESLRKWAKAFDVAGTQRTAA